ncbi:MAG: hypothetical protein P1V97_38255, partial [Planctomycetota bacterium]|nr:hypothetical protein [Planctomycetota bacterium]
MTEFHPREAALGRYLIERGILSMAQAQFFLEKGQRENQALMTVLCQQGILTPEAAKQLFFDAQTKIDKNPTHHPNSPPAGALSPLFVSSRRPNENLVVTLKEDASRPSLGDASITPFDADEPPTPSEAQPNMESCFDGPRYEFVEGDTEDSFLALDVALDKSVLMKLGPEANKAKTFIREALILASLDHPCIPRVLDIGERAGRVFFTLDQSPGKALSESYDVSDIGLLPRLRSVLDVCDALKHAGQKGLVHGRLDPSVLFVGDYGRILVSGWSDAFVLRDSPLRHKITVKPTKFISSSGTAPELQAGENPQLSADVWSLGQLMTVLIFERVLDTIPDALLAIQQKATAPNPEHRYPNAGALGDDIRAFLDDERVSALAEGPLRSVRRFAQRHSIPSAFFVVSLVIIIITAALTITDWLQARNEEQRAQEAALNSQETKAAAKIQVTQSLSELGDFLA